MCERGENTYLPRFTTSRMTAFIFFLTIFTITLNRAASFPAALSASHDYLQNVHLQELRSVVDNTLELENAVVALLERYTLGAERVIKSADKLQNAADLTPQCKSRVLGHLENRLVSQFDRSAMAVDSIRAATSPTGPTAKALEHLEILADRASGHADEIEECLSNCDAATAAAFGKPAGQGGGVVAASAAQSAKLDCAKEAKDLRREMEKSTERTKSAIEKTARELSNANSNIGARMSGEGVDQEHAAESKRNADLNEYKTVRDQHEHLSQVLEKMLLDRTNVLEGARLAREQSSSAIKQLRRQCDAEMARRVSILNHTNTSSKKFLKTIERSNMALSQALQEEVEKNNVEAKYAASLSAQVDAAAEDCARAMQSLTSRVIKLKQEQHRSNEETARAVASLLRGKGTKGDAPESPDVDEQAMKWAGKVIATHHEREMTGGRPKASEIPLLLVEESSKNDDDEQQTDNDNDKVQQQDQQQQDQDQQTTDGDSDSDHKAVELKELKSQALLIDQKLQKAEKTGKVGEKLPADLVGNAEATSESFWNDLSTLKDSDAENATPEEEREVGQMVTEVSKMDDDLITPQSEDKVPMEYSKLTEEIGELKGEGEI